MPVRLLISLVLFGTQRPRRGTRCRVSRAGARYCNGRATCRCPPLLPSPTRKSILVYTWPYRSLSAQNRAKERRPFAPCIQHAGASSLTKIHIICTGYSDCSKSPGNCAASHRANRRWRSIPSLSEGRHPLIFAAHHLVCWCQKPNFL